MTATQVLEMYTVPQSSAGTGRPTTLHRAYFWAYATALLLCWSPFKAIAYAAPLICAVLIVLASPTRSVILRCIGCVVAITFLLSAWLLFDRTFVITSALVSIVTYSTFGFLFIIPSRSVVSPWLAAKMLRLTVIAVGIEAVAGIIQAVVSWTVTGAFDSANGDAVQGTIYPYAHSDAGFANPMFGASMTLLTLALVADRRRAMSRYAALALGAASLVFASVLHQLIYLLVAFVVAFVIVRPKLPNSMSKAPLLAVFVGIPFLSLWLLSDNIGTIGAIVTDFTSGRSPRRSAIEQAVFTLPSEDHWMPVLGLGPGQFCSRAALISSGYYLGTPKTPTDIGYIHRVAIPEFEVHVLPLFRAAASVSYYGSTQKPFFSWLSIYTEFGGIVVIGLAWMIGSSLRRIRHASRQVDDRYPYFAVATGFIFLCLIGFHENYLEVPQAILPGCMVLKALAATLGRVRERIS